MSDEARALLQRNIIARLPEAARKAFTPEKTAEALDAYMYRCKLRANLIYLRQINPRHGGRD